MVFVDRIIVGNELIRIINYTSMKLKYIRVARLINYGMERFRFTVFVARLTLGK